jgi:hypothetical protein
MSLIAFHRFLISTGILFCAAFAVWEFRAYAANGGALSIVLAVTFTILASGLVFYLSRLKRFLGYDRRGR